MLTLVTFLTPGMIWPLVIQGGVFNQRESVILPMTIMTIMIPSKCDFAHHTPDPNIILNIPKTNLQRQIIDITYHVVYIW